MRRILREDYIISRECAGEFRDFNPQMNLFNRLAVGGGNRRLDGLAKDLKIYDNERRGSFSLDESLKTTERSGLDPNKVTLLERVDGPQFWRIPRRT